MMSTTNFVDKRIVCRNGCISIFPNTEPDNNNYKVGGHHPALTHNRRVTIISGLFI